MGEAKYMDSWGKIRKAATAFFKCREPYSRNFVIPITNLATPILHSPFSIVHSYGYDGIGNSTNWSANCLNQYTADVATTSPSSPFSYDPDGNLLTNGVFSYAYDAENRLASVSSNGTVLAAFAYDAQGRRVRKVTPSATHTYFYDGWLLVREILATNHYPLATIDYVWGKDLSGTLQGAGGVGGLLYIVRSEYPVTNSQTHNSQTHQLYMPTYDNNGNITRYCDEQGNIVASYTYSAFGATIAQGGSMTDSFPHRFSTKYLDSETGLYYYGYRFDSPELMRWMNRDPIEEEGGENLYAMCGNCPINEVDSRGMHRFLTGALLYHKGKSLRLEGYETARKIIRLVDSLNSKTDSKGRKCFEVKIKDFVTASIDEVRNEIDTSPDDVYLIAHGGLIVNGESWSGSEYRWGLFDNVVEGFDIRHDGNITPLSEFGPNLNHSNIFGCYLSERVRKRRFSQRWGKFSSIDTFNAMFQALLSRLHRYENITTCRCVKMVSIYEGERTSNGCPTGKAFEKFPIKDESDYADEYEYTGELL